LRIFYLAGVYLPVALPLKTQLQKPVAGIVSFAAVRAGQIGAKMSAMVIVIWGHREGGSTAARDQKHREAAWLTVRRFTLALHS
jgi:hypothetical protein